MSDFQLQQQCYPTTPIHDPDFVFKKVVNNILFMLYFIKRAAKKIRLFVCCLQRCLCGGEPNHGDVHAWRTETRARKAIHQCFIIKSSNSIQYMSCSIQLLTDAEEFFVQFSSRWSFRRKPADFPKVYRKLRTKFIIIGIYRGVSDRIFKNKSKTRQVS